MEDEKICKDHDRHKRYVCLSDNCNSLKEFLCVICVKSNHSNCNDNELLSIGQFVLGAVEKIHINNKKKIKENCKKEEFLFFKSKDIEDNKKSKEDNFEDAIDKKIESWMNKIKSNFLDLRQEALEEKEIINKIRLDNFDEIKKFCEINFDLESKKLFIKTKNSNKISKFLSVSNFLKKDFKYKFESTKKQLIKFEALTKNNPFPLFLTPLLQEHKINNNIIELKKDDKKNWENENGFIHQIGLINLPFVKCSFFLEIQNLNFKSNNIDLLVLNEECFNFWSKKLKFNEKYNFRKMPCLAKFSFCLEEFSKFKLFCENHTIRKSLKMSYKGCQKIVNKIKLAVDLDLKKQKLYIKEISGNIIHEVSLQQSSISNENQSNQKDYKLNEDAIMNSLNDEADWEDLSDGSYISNTSSEEIEGNTKEIFTSRQVKDWRVFNPRGPLYLGFHWHNEYVSIAIDSIYHKEKTRK